MKPASFRERHDARRMAALEAAQALSRGQREPARGLIEGWLFAPSDRLVDILLEALSSAPPSPGQGALAALLEPLPRAEHRALRDGHVGERYRVKDLLAQPQGLRPPDPTSRVAWGLAMLALLGHELDRLERRAWQERVYDADPVRDDQARAWWELWLHFPSSKGADGRLAAPPLTPAQWAALHDGWRSLFLPAALDTFSRVLSHVNCPHAARIEQLETLREQSFLRLMDGQGPYLGWVELACRTVERRHRGQVDALALLGGPAAWHRAARCAGHRGSRRDSVRAIWPELRDRELRAQRLASCLSQGDRQLETPLDFHVALRLVRDWADPGRCCIERSWRVMRQNRGRAAARLRALAAEERPTELVQAILAAPSPYERTLAAVRTYYWAWGLKIVVHGTTDSDPDLMAWHADAWAMEPDRLTAAGADFVDHDGGLTVCAAVDFNYRTDVDVTPPCSDPPGDPTALTDGERQALRSWVLLVILKGYLGQLRIWTRTAGGEKGGGWGRLLANDLPDCLRDPADAERRRSTYTRLRSILGLGLEPLLEGLHGDLEAIASMDPKRSPKSSFGLLLRPDWHEDVPFPRSGFPSFVRNVRDALPALSDKEDMPCPW